MFTDASVDVNDAPDGEGAELLDQLLVMFDRFVVFPSEHAQVAVVLWTAATHGQPAWEHATRLVIKSPVKRCGKSRLLDLVDRLAFNVLMTVNISVAALVRSIAEADPPTLLVDEADSIFGTKQQAANHEDLRGILNSGHQRGRPYVRWDMTARKLESCPTFAMAALAGIGDMPDTVEDRAIVVTMRRRAPGEQVTPLRRRRHVGDMLELRDRLHDWVRGSLAKLGEVEPVMPDGVEDRAADCWEPLLAIAEAAGGRWPELALQACTAMTAAAEEDSQDSAGERLLADLQTVFGDRDALTTKTILDGLEQIEEAPWADWFGKGLDANTLARLLRPYGIKPRTIRVGTATPRGYRQAELADAWARYTDPTRNTRNTRNIAGQRVLGVAPSVATRNTRNAVTRDVAPVAGVAPTLTDPGEDGQVAEVAHHPGAGSISDWRLGKVREARDAGMSTAQIAEVTSFPRDEVERLLATLEAPK